MSANGPLGLLSHLWLHWLLHNRAQGPESERVEGKEVLASVSGLNQDLDNESYACCGLSILLCEMGTNPQSM